ncbi:MAG: TadE/TadG family type IV pilus assembly protein [Xanthobacteraceae bacterium]|jgi:Flp pilus assembly protein TadG
MRPAMKPIAAMVRLGARMAADGRAAVAVEFAAVLPLMLLLYIGGVDVASGVSAARKVTQTSRTVADLASRAIGPLATADVANTVLNVASAVMSPFNNPTNSQANAQLIVSQVCVDANKNAYVQWSQSTSNTTPHSFRDPVPTLPNSLATPNTWLIWGEATYLYTPTIGYYVIGTNGTLKLYDNIFMVPRNLQYIQLNGVPSSTNCPGP